MLGDVRRRRQPGPFRDHSSTAQARVHGGALALERAGRRTRGGAGRAASDPQRVGTLGAPQSGEDEIVGSVCGFSWPYRVVVRRRYGPSPMFADPDSGTNHSRCAPPSSRSARACVLAVCNSTSACAPSLRSLDGRTQPCPVVRPPRASYDREGSARGPRQSAGTPRPERPPNLTSRGDIHDT
jgi:hypothetical protein